jgi:hypothetical protein
MALVVRENSQPNRKFELPPEGAHHATLEAVKDVGFVQTSFGEKHRVRFVWRLDEKAGNGDTLKAFQAFNLSFDSKSHLRKNVKQILGRDPGSEFDLESLVGSRATLVLAHDETSSGTFANVRAILPLRDGGAA